MTDDEEIQRLKELKDRLVQLATVVQATKQNKADKEQCPDVGEWVKLMPSNIEPNEVVALLVTMVSANLSLQKMPDILAMATHVAVELDCFPGDKAVVIGKKGHVPAWTTHFHSVELDEDATRH